MLSIITPTYNRGHLLDNAYQSLLRQDNKNFVWIIIDDGGTDNTEAVCRSWIEEGKIKILYERQENGGVNRARNRGVELALGEILLYLDDDDYLSDDAVSTVYHHWETIKDNSKIVGMLFLSGKQETGEIIGQSFHSDVSINNYINIYYRERIKGDKTVVHKTEVQRNYPFPAFDGERFAPEGIMFNRISKEYDYLCVNKILQYKEYLENGITKSGYPESEIMKGLLTLHYEQTDKIFPYHIRRRSMRMWIALKLLSKTPLLSVFRESKKPLLCLVCFPRALVKFLCMSSRQTNKPKQSNS